VIEAIGRGIDAPQGLNTAAVNIKYRSAIRTSVDYLISSNSTLETRFISKYTEIKGFEYLSTGSKSGSSDW